MESSLVKERLMKYRRSLRVRKKVRGSLQKPRLCVVKTNKNIYVQLIDDESGRVLASISTIAKTVNKTAYSKKNKESAKFLGIKIAELGKALEVDQVVFDRGPFKYHGVIAMVADGAREGGLLF